MAKNNGPKDRLSRRESYDLFGKGTKLTRLAVPPGVHGPKGFKKTSQYGRQLREKQKVKRIYGVLEKQFRNYYGEASRKRGNTGEHFLSLLERRLDNVVYRMGFAPTRPGARQLISHKHILVNGKKLNIPSYRVSIGDVVTLDKTAVEIPYIKALITTKDVKVPGWIKRKAIVGVIDRNPIRDDISEPISEQDIIEFYSR